MPAPSTASAVAWYVFFRRATGLRAPAVLLPARAELEDYRALASRVRARCRSRLPINLLRAATAR